MKSERHKRLLVQALREYPTWGDAYIGERDRAEKASALLLEIEGAILGYWTDMPGDVIEDLRVRVRDFLGDWEPTQEPG